MSSNVQPQIDQLNAAVATMNSSLTQITGNTLLNYNQLTRINSQQSNILTSIQTSGGNLNTGTIRVSNNSNVNGTLFVDQTATIVSNLFNSSNMNLNKVTFLAQADNGYIRFGNIMVQWGNEPNVVTTGRIIPVFNPSFSGTPYCALVQRNDTTGVGVANDGVARVTDISSTSMSIDPTFGTTSKSPFYWLAIGPYTV